MCCSVPCGSTSVPGSVQCALPVDMWICVLRVQCALRVNQCALQCAGDVRWVEGERVKRAH